MPGPFFQDCTPDPAIEHAVRRTVTETDDVPVAAPTHDVRPFADIARLGR